MITLRSGVARDPYNRVIEAELLVEAKARLEEIEAAEAAAVRDAQQKKDALFIVRQIAAALCKPEDAVQRGADFISFVDDLLDDAGFIAEARIAFIEAHGFKVEREGDAYAVAGANGYHVTGDASVLVDAYERAEELAKDDDE